MPSSHTYAMINKNFSYFTPASQLSFRDHSLSSLLVLDFILPRCCVLVVKPRWGLQPNAIPEIEQLLGLVRERLERRLCTQFHVLLLLISDSEKIVSPSNCSKIRDVNSLSPLPFGATFPIGVSSPGKVGPDLDEHPAHLLVLLRDGRVEGQVLGHELEEELVGVAHEVLELLEDVEPEIPRPNLELASSFILRSLKQYILIVSLSK